MNTIILKHFLDSNLKIISIKNLEIYIDFCIKNNKKIKIKYRNNKISKNTTREYTDLKGEITTIAKKVGKKSSITKLKKSKRYNVLHIQKGLIKKDILLKDIKKNSHGLYLKTKKNFLGMTNLGKTKLIKKGKEELIGMYVEEIKNN